MEPFKREDTAKGASLFLLQEWIAKRPGLTAGFSSRIGGVSSAPWASLNCGLHVGDDAEAVLQNRQRLTEALGWPFDAWTCAEQVHGDRVMTVSAAERGRGRLSSESSVGEADALVTDEPGVLLVSFYADCVPLYFLDPVRGVVALAHAGWKGTVKQIAARTVETMCREFGCSVHDIFGAIGPSIGICCYEVDGAALEAALALAGELTGGQAAKAAAEPAAAGAGEPLIEPSSAGKARINLKEMNRQIMIKAGILPSNIELTEWCTGCSTDTFFSHRMEGGATGRMVSWIGMERGEARS